MLCLKLSLEARSTILNLLYEIKLSLLLLCHIQPLPWLAESALENRERERKERLHRQVQQQAFSEGKGFGPAPATKNVQSTQPYVYVSAYNR